MTMILLKNSVLEFFIFYFLIQIFFYIEKNISFKLKDIDERDNYAIISYLVLTCNAKFRFCMITNFTNKSNDVKLYHLFTLLFFK